MGNVEATKTVTAKIDTGAPATSVSAGTGVDLAQWHNHPLTLAFTASDPNLYGTPVPGYPTPVTPLSGVATTEYKVDAGAWTTGTSVTVSAEGDHLLSYRSTDNAGNVEAAKSVHAMINTSAPDLTVTSGGEDLALWHNHAITLTIAASDSEGIKSIEYQLDGGAWTAGTTVAIAAPIDHSADGDHVIGCRATDNADNSCTPATVHVMLDTRKPVTKAPYAARVTRYRTATLRYRVNDVAPNAGTATATIKIRNSRGVVVKTLTLGTQAVNTLLSKRFVCKLPKGTYRFSVYAKDAAGNKQSKVGSNTLTVK